MRMIWKGIRAVTVETIGVVAVVWMLFAATSWTLESAGEESKPDAVEVWRWVDEAVGEVTASWPKMAELLDRPATFGFVVSSE